MLLPIVVLRLKEVNWPAKESELIVVNIYKCVCVVRELIQGTMFYNRFKSTREILFRYLLSACVSCQIIYIVVCALLDIANHRIAQLLCNGINSNIA